MKKLILSLFLLLAITVQAQEPTLKIRDFKGLNTVSSDFTIPPNEARVAHNIDFSRKIGSITKRYGYEAISTISGMDSIIAIYGAYYSDGTQQLFVVTDSAGIGYGAVYVTPKGSANLDSLTKIYSFWSVFGFPSFTMFNDDVYIVNGYSRGIIYSNGITRDYPPKAPGEPTIVPLNDSGGLDGRYRYVFMSSRRFLGTQYDNNGYVSSPIKVTNGQILLTNFQWIIGDSVTPTPDTLALWIYRSKGDIGRLDDGDYAYYTGNLLIHTTASGLSADIIIDSISDNSISSNDSIKIIDAVKYGRDSLGVIEYRYGSPLYLGVDSTMSYNLAGDTNAPTGVFYGVQSNEDTLGFSYICTFIDTVTSIESDSSRSLNIWVDTSARSGGAKPESYIIGLPRIPDSDSGLVINIYRGVIERISYDSTYWSTKADSIYYWGYTGRDDEEGSPISDWIWSYYSGWVSKDAVDTIIVRNYYLVAQVSSNDTVFTDDIRQDSVETRRRFRKTTVPSIFNDIISFEGRLYGVENSRLWRSGLLNSLVDTLQTWGQMDFQTFNESDGDIGTLVYPTRTAIRFFKNFSNFNVYDDFSKTELSGTIGCIAPESHASGINGHYYLSNAGVVFETEGQQLERTFNTSIVSSKLINFDNMSISTKKDAKAFYVDRKYMLSIGDTTYVFDDKVGEWATWSIKIGSATKYGVESQVDFIPSDSMYFVEPGGSVLYRYGGTEYDFVNSKPIATWTTGPLYNLGHEVSIDKLGLWANNSGDTLSVTLGDRIFDIEGSTSRYQIKSISGSLTLLPTLTLQLAPKKYGITFQANDVSIDGIDVWLLDKGKILEE